MTSKLLAVPCRLILIVACGIAALSTVALGMRIPAIGLTVLGTGAWVKLRRRWQGHGWAYGTARMSTMLDLAHYGLLGERGWLMGCAGFTASPSRTEAIRGLFSPFIRSDLACRLFLSTFMRLRLGRDVMVRIHNPTHAGCFAPSGKGKGVSVLIPNLLSFPGSAVVTDPKGELFLATAAHRQRVLGHRIAVFDPFGICGAWSDTLNPLSLIDATSDDFLDQCRDLANMLVMRTGTEPDPHWNDSAELVLTAFIAFICACESNPDDRNLQVLRKLVSSPYHFDRAIETMLQVEGYHGLIERLAGMLGWFQDRERGSVMTTVQRHTAVLDTLPVAASLAKTTFNPAELRDRPTTLYLVCPHDKLNTLAPLMRVWIGTTLRAITRDKHGERNPVTFFLDEAAHLGKIRALEDAVTMMRGMGVRLFFFFQSLSQLKACYGEKASVILDNLDTQIYFGTNAHETAEEISKKIGDATVLVETLNESSSRSWNEGNGREPGGVNKSFSTSYNLSETGRRLLKPEEVLTLPSDMGLVFHRNLPVVPVRLVKHFADPVFRGGGTGRTKSLGLGSVAASAVMLLASLFYAGMTAVIPFLAAEQGLMPFQRAQPPEPILPLGDLDARFPPGTSRRFGYPPVTPAAAPRNDVPPYGYVPGYRGMGGASGLYR